MQGKDRSTLIWSSILALTINTRHEQLFEITRYVSVPYNILTTCMYSSTDPPPIRTRPLARSSQSEGLSRSKGYAAIGRCHIYREATCRSVSLPHSRRTELQLVIWPVGWACFCATVTSAGNRLDSLSTLIVSIPSCCSQGWRRVGRPQRGSPQQLCSMTSIFIALTLHAFPDS